MNLLLLRLHQIAKKFNSLDTTARQKRQNFLPIFQEGFDLMICYEACYTNILLDTVLLSTYTNS